MGKWAQGADGSVEQRADRTGQGSVSLNWRARWSGCAKKDRELTCRPSRVAVDLYGVVLCLVNNIHLFGVVEVYVSQ